MHGALSEHVIIAVGAAYESRTGVIYMQYSERARNMKALRFALGYAAAALLFAAAAALLWLAADAAGMTARLFGRDESVSGVPSYPLVVIDPGHGGEDAGASGNNLRESDVNLDVSLRCAATLRMLGIPVRLTRADDRLLYDEFGDLDDYTGRKKAYDLKNRLRIASENPNAILISVHMNSFPDSRYGGLQVWYSRNNASSSALAVAVQTHSRTYVDPSNSRKIKPGRSMYLLDRAEMPAIIVECGFLTNESDAQRLASDTGRAAIAVSMAAAAAVFLDAYTNG